MKKSNRTMEVGEAVAALDILDHEGHLAVALFF